MNDITMTIGGQPYRLATLEARQLQQFLDYAKKTMPDPIDEVIETAAKLPDSIKDKFLERHLDAAFEKKKLRGTISDPDFEAFLQRPEGYQKMFCLMFHKHQPNLTEAQVIDLAFQGLEEHGPDFFTNLHKAGTKVPLSESEVEKKILRSQRLSHASKKK